MKRILIIFLALFLFSAPAFAETDCDVWLGTWDVVYEDDSTAVWFIDEIITGTSTNIPCQAVGTSTPDGGGDPVNFQIIQVVFWPNFVYTESSKLGEEQESLELLLDNAGETFTEGPQMQDYDIKSGAKRVSGPRCGGVEPAFVSAGDNSTLLTINGNETSFDNSSTVLIGCDAIDLVSYTVVSATEVSAVIDVAEDAEDTNCSVSVTTGEESISCSVEVRGVGDPERVAWEFETGGPVYSAAAVSGGYIYFGSGDFKVYCLNAATGEKVWEYETGNAVLSSPAVTNGKVYIGSNDMKVYCLDADNGTKLWEYETGEAVQGSPAIVDGYVYVPSYDNKIYCLNAETGACVWDFTTTEDVFSTPAVVDGKVYVGGVDYYLYCLDAATGTELWKFETDGDIPPSPAVADGRVFFGNKGFKLFGVDADTGLELWRYETGGICYSSPAVYEDFVFSGSNDNHLYCLNTEDGSLVWKYQAGSNVQSSPAVTDDYVYFGSADKNVYCLDFKFGQKQWSYKTGDMVHGSPTVKDGLVYVGSFDGSMYCLYAPEDESEKWPMYRYDLARTGYSKESLCLAETALDSDAARIAQLRDFRDQVLAESASGRKVIDLYNRVSPRMRDFCEDHPLVKKTVRSLLIAVTPLISAMTNQ